MRNRTRCLRKGLLRSSVGEVTHDNCLYMHSGVLFLATSSDMAGLDEALDRLQSDYMNRLFGYLDTGASNPSNAEVMEAYTTVHSFMSQERLRSRLYSFYTQQIRLHLTSLLPSLTPLPSPSLLPSLLLHWNNHLVLLHWMYKVFHELDLKYVKLMGFSQNLRLVIDQGVDIFREIVVEGVRKELGEEILREFNRFRDDIQIDTERLKAVLEVLLHLCFHSCQLLKSSDHGLKLTGVPNLTYYNEFLTAALVSESERYYELKAAKWLLGCNATEYVRQAKEAVEREETFLNDTLESEISGKILTVMYKSVISQPASTVIDLSIGGAEDLFRHDNRSELKCMFKLYSRVDATLCHVANKMEKYVVSKGMDIVTDPQWKTDSPGFVTAMLALLREVDSMVEDCFDSHKLFVFTKEHAFQQVMNATQHPLQYLAQAFDVALRVTMKSFSESEVDHHLDSLLSLVSFLQDRDVFLRIYTRDLGHRLLSSKSISEYIESTVIRRLKLDWGMSGIGRMVAMMQDLDISRGISSEFCREFQEEKMTVQVLRTGCWPEQIAVPCAFPGELDELKVRFEGFYKERHKGRNLGWNLSLGQCELVSCYLPKRYVFSLAPYLSTVLLLFNSSDSLTLTHISAVTNIPIPTLQLHLQPLLSQKCKILLTSGEEKKLTELDEFRLNLEFESNAIRIKVPRFKGKQVQKIEEEDRKAILLERRNVLDSVIVRIAKSRKSVKYAELVQEVVRQVSSFRPGVGMVKEQVESLLLREYLQRDKEDSSVLVYMP